MTEEIEFSRVNAAPYNPRVLLTQEDQDWKDIEASMEEFGLVQPYVWNKRSGNLVGGHQRMNIERHRGKDRGPMVVVDLGPEQEKKLNLALNSVGGRWDPGKLLTVLADMKLAQIDVGTLGLRKLEALKILPIERSKAEARKTLAQRFGVPPFSVLDARQGYWQERKKAWLALGIQSELGRGSNYLDISAAQAGITDPEEVEKWNEACRNSPRHRRQPPAAAPGPLVTIASENAETATGAP